MNGEQRAFDAILRCHGGLQDLLRGEDPTQVERLWQKMYDHTGLFGRRGVTIAAIGAVETALWDIAAKDDSANARIGDVVALDCTGSYLRGDGLLVAAIGLTDIVVVATRDAVMVAPRDRVQEVKRLVDSLKAEKRGEVTAQRVVYRPWGYADNRDLRRQILEAYTTRNRHGDEYDNKAIVSRIAALRAQRAQLLGYKSHADYVIDENMAKTPAAVYELLAKLWTPTRAMLVTEAAAQQAIIDKAGRPFTLEAWDWRYYTEKVKKARFDLDDQVMRPYFPLDSVLDGAFHVANRLYGLTFIPRPDLPVYHPEVEVLRGEGRRLQHPGVIFAF